MNPKARTSKPIATFHTHSWFVYTVAFSPDSRTLAAGTLEDAGFSLIDTKTWKVRHVLPELDSPPHQAAFSPDGQSMIVSMGRESGLSCWDTQSGACKWSSKSGTNAAVFSPDRRAVTVTRGKEIVVCSVQSGQVIRVLKGHSSGVAGLDLSPDGKRMLSVAGGQVMLWDTRKGAQIAVVQEKMGMVSAASFSPSGKQIVVAGAKGIRWYGGIKGEMVDDCSEHTDIWDVSFTPDGKRLVTCDSESMNVWDTASRQVLFHIEAGGPMVEVSPDGNYVASSGDGGIGLWCVKNGEPAAQIPVPGGFGGDDVLTFSPNGLWLAAACADEKARVWALKDVLR
jgi:WD40 repeat protein